MKLIFWENIISHLRTPFFKGLLKIDVIEVLLIVDQELTENRKKLGWIVNKIKGLEYIVGPDEQQVIELIDSNKNAQHFLSGINVYNAPSLALKHLVKRKVCFSIYSEQFKGQGIKGILRQLKSKIDYYKYNQYIKAIYAIGDDAVSWYKKAGYDNNRIHQWIYFSEPFETKEQKKQDSILFVGELSERKNILFLVNTFLGIEYNNNVKLKIIGSGLFEKEIQKHAKTHPNKIEYLGVLPTHLVRLEMSKSKVLVLPSIFDGWGAVVNEALLSGCFCITSDKCGSKTLFRNNAFLGQSFQLNDKGSMTLENVLQDKIQNISVINGSDIYLWANKNLDIEKAVTYFIQTIKYQKKEIQSKPKAPWLN